jgi:hypothetical protein
MEYDDGHLIQAYTSLGKSVDTIAAFPDVRRGFPGRLATHNDDGEAVWRLIELGKTGKPPKISTRRNRSCN